MAANGTRRERIAVLKQDGNHVTGVLLSPTGDSRALEGNVVDGQLRLSGFTGPAPSLYHGALAADGKLAGTVYGLRNNQAFEAVRDDTATLPDPYSLTRATSDGPVRFTFPDANGTPVSLDDPRYRGKVVAVQILGTWCPNCADETRFLALWYSKHRSRGVEVVGIAFEQEDDAQLAARTLPRYREFYGIDYALLFGGSLDKAAAGVRLPWLNEVVAYPTLVLLDRQGRVREIYTGFNSPETGKPNRDFVDRFNATVDALLAEPVSGS
ncbi:TlpA family protein disulfide reductase [Pseudoxanthomonas sp. NC8]|nr:TlpA family protein disulfide reductase [Pseudoxanthomonas sp. NC8]